MEETDWFPLTACPVRPGVYKTLHLGGQRQRIEGYSNWILGKGWGQTESTLYLATHHNKWPSSQQSKQWKGLTEETK